MRLIEHGATFFGGGMCLAGARVVATVAVSSLTTRQSVRKKRLSKSKKQNNVVVSRNKEVRRNTRPWQTVSYAADGIQFGPLPCRSPVPLRVSRRRHVTWQLPRHWRGFFCTAGDLHSATCMTSTSTSNYSIILSIRPGGDFLRCCVQRQVTVHSSHRFPSRLR